MSAGTSVADLEADPAVRGGSLAWAALADDVNEFGMAQTGQRLSAVGCRSISALYEEDGLFRSTIDMARYRFGSGQYRYFSRPVPALVAQLRTAFYPYLLPIARDWAAKLGKPDPWPDTLPEWLDMCQTGGQTKSTPILLRY